MPGCHNQECDAERWVIEANESARQTGPYVIRHFLQFSSMEELERRKRANIACKIDRDIEVSGCWEHFLKCRAHLEETLEL